MSHAPPPPAPRAPASPSAPTPPRTPLWQATRRLLISPVERFLAIEAASGILLLVAAALAMLLANSPLASLYQGLWHVRLGLTLGSFGFARDLHFFVNDGLMVVFFFVVGLEIRREIHNGELSDRRRAALPAIAALGGMIAPACIYLAINPTGPAARGWGVPTATDIAFAVGVLALLGKRVPPALRVLLLALAVIDDLGAIIVIALFYTGGVDPRGLVVVAAGLGGILLFRRLGLRAPLAYLPFGLVVWAGALATGVHPTLAGVVLGLITPVQPREGEALAPAARLEAALHGWVAYVIMPLFAFANAGVPIGAVELGAGETAILAGVGLGLVLGKPLGVVLISVLAVRAKLAALPPGIGGRQLLVLGLAAGIGFTMALFVAGLAFPPGPGLEAAKLGVLGASLVAGLAGLAAGRLLLPRQGP